MKTEGCFVKNKFFPCIVLKFVDKVLNYLNNDGLFVISVSFLTKLNKEISGKAWLSQKIIPIWWPQAIMKVAG